MADKEISYDVKAKRYKDDKGKFTKKAGVRGLADDAAAELKDSGVEFTGDQAKEVEKLAAKAKADLDKEFDAIEKSKTTVKDVTTRIESKLKKLIEKDKQGSGKLTASISLDSDRIKKQHSTGDITKEQAGKEVKQIDQDRADVLHNMRQSVLPKWMPGAQASLETKKQQGGVTGWAAAKGASVLKQYEQQVVDKSKYKEYAKDVDKTFDKKKEETVSRVKLTDNEQIIKLLEQIAENTGGSVGGTEGNNKNNVKKMEEKKEASKPSMAKMLIGGALLGSLAKGESQEGVLKGMTGAAVGGVALGKAFVAKGGDYAKRISGIFKSKEKKEEKAKKKEGGGLLAKLIPMLMGLVTKLISGFTSVINMLMKAGSLLRGAISGLGKLAKAAAPVVKKAATAAGNALKTGAKAVGNVAKSVGSKVVNAARAVAPRALAALSPAAAVASAGAAGYAVGTAINKYALTDKDGNSRLFNSKDLDPKEAGSNEVETITAALAKAKNGSGQVHPMLLKRAKELNIPIPATVTAKGSSPDKGNALAKVEQDKSSIDRKTQQDGVNAITSSNKNITVNAPASKSVVGSSKPRNEESSLHIFLASRMQYA